MSLLRKIAPFFVIGALFIVMAHALIPHHHHSTSFDHELCELEDDHEHDSFLGGLLEVFELDQDPERLQNIATQSYGNLLTVFVFTFFEVRSSTFLQLSLSKPFWLEACYTWPDLQLSVEQILINSFSHRGPPLA